MQVSIVAAISDNRVIGENNRVPWKIKQDLVRLKNLTKDQTVILGRKTYDSMIAYYSKSGRPMPGKLYLVITHNPDYKPVYTNTQVASSLSDALMKAKVNKVTEVFIIGGGQIYAQTIRFADKLYLTIVHKNISGDAYFPDFSKFSKVISKQESQSGDFRYTFLELAKS